MNRLYLDIAEGMRQSNVSYLIDKLKALGVPSHWHTSIADRSISVTNPGRSHTVKVGDDGILVLDVLYKGKVKSSRFACGSVEKAWPMAETAIKSYIRMEQCKQTSKSSG